MMQAALIGTHILTKRLCIKTYKRASTIASSSLERTGLTPGLPDLHPATCYLARLREDLEYRFEAVIECVLRDASRDDTGSSLPPKLFHYTSSTAAKSIAAEGSL